MYTEVQVGRKFRVVHTVSSLRGGGMEHFVLRLAEAQQRLGHAVTIIALQGGPLEDHARQMGIRTIVLGGSNRHLRIINGATTMAILRPHIAHAHNPTSLHYALLGKIFGGAKLVMTDHAATRGVVRKPGNSERKKTDVVVCVSHETARNAPRDHGIIHNLQVIHNGIEMKPAKRSREAVRAELGLGDRFVGTMVAGFDRVKGHDVLLRALAICRDMRTNVTILILGDGDERGNIERLQKELKLDEEFVRLLGFRSDVPDLLGAADFGILPSRNEGLPLAVLEAMSHRLPVIATPVGGVPELVEDGIHGIIVPVDDPEATANAIATLAADANLRSKLGAAGFELVNKQFTFAEMTRKYEDLYHSLWKK